MQAAPSDSEQQRPVVTFLPLQPLFLQGHGWQLWCCLPSFLLYSCGAADAGTLRCLACGMRVSCMDRRLAHEAPRAA